ncbi:diamine acetyltransferase 2-like isoform X2 [Mizuhopecten yessoensis]|uniref:diamine acetyltransferase 2-like isoform X2 n=1 Tax=Mizuhopecten yessoensis TaxID=6573 RepID=UPI000B459E94|nr:diamine acetyltransferase 2-like isoform X2 [Mizuhopecten yessoensis]
MWTKYIGCSVTFKRTRRGDDNARKVEARSEAIPVYGSGEYDSWWSVLHINTNNILNVLDSASKPLLGFALYVYKYDACKGQMAILDSFYVAPENRSRGIGLSLMKAVEQDVAECGCSQMEMLVHDWNARAIEFYLKRSAVNYTDQMHWHIYRIPLSNISKT